MPDTKNSPQHPEIGNAIEYAAQVLPAGWSIQIVVERGSGWVELYAPSHTTASFDGDDLTLTQQIREAIYAARWRAFGPGAAK